MSKVTFDLQMYDTEAIKSAIVAFNDYATIGFERIGNTIECTICGCRYDEQVTIGQFENYVLNASMHQMG